MHFYTGESSLFIQFKLHLSSLTCSELASSLKETFVKGALQLFTQIRLEKSKAAQTSNFFSTGSELSFIISNVIVIIVTIILIMMMMTTDGGLFTGRGRSEG